MTIKSYFKNVYMKMQGYTPVELKDTRILLKGTQKYKYVKAGFDFSGDYNGFMKETVLPSGTKTRVFLPKPGVTSEYSKYVYDYKNKFEFMSKLKLLSNKLKALECTQILHHDGKVTLLNVWKRVNGKLVKKLI